MRISSIFTCSRQGTVDHISSAIDGFDKMDKAQTGMHAGKAEMMDTKNGVELGTSQDMQAHIR